MFNDFRPCFAEINLDNFRHNFREVKRLTQGKKIFGVIKADGYGHGAVELARILDEENADYFAVAVLKEALDLRKNGFKTPILVLGFTPPNFAKEIVENDITQTVFSFASAQAISNEAIRQNKTAKIHIKVDTGMGRVGYPAEDIAVSEIKRISKLDNIYVEGIFSHFATSDEVDKYFAYRQLEKFEQMIYKLLREGIEFEIKHLCNSGAIIDMPEAYFDAVRPGIMLYGYYPSHEVKKERLTLKPVMTLKANIAHIKEVPDNTSIGYGRTFYTNRVSKIATLPLGYADGFSRLLFRKAKVIVNGVPCSVVGRICMDQCMIDVTECSNVEIGDEVTLIGDSNGISNNVDVIAKHLGTISNEVLCMISKRVPRVYTNNGKILEAVNL
jgi:alanine racemase